MEIKPEHAARLDLALTEAEINYWSVVTKYFPEARTSGFPPAVGFIREEHNKKDLLLWLQYNAPQLMVGYEEDRAEQVRAELPENTDPERVTLTLNYMVYFEDGSSVSMFGTYGEVFEAYPSATKILVIADEA